MKAQYKLQKLKHLRKIYEKEKIKVIFEVYRKRRQEATLNSTIRIMPLLHPTTHLIPTIHLLHHMHSIILPT